MEWLPIELNPVLVGIAAAVVAYLIGRSSGAGAGRQVATKLESQVARLESVNQEQRRESQEMRARVSQVDAYANRLQRSLAELPEIAQRLSASKNVREIPERALDLVQELFDPSYAVLYRARGEDLIAVANRGDCEYPRGHRLKLGEGVVGWTAMKQLPLTSEDVQTESRLVREKNLSQGVPQAGFTVCLPILKGSVTIAVLLIGPSSREFGNPRAIGRTIALLTGMALLSAAELKQQTQKAQIDGLTGLLNKVNIVLRIEQIIAGVGDDEAEVDGPRSVSVFLLDIDHFKNYNDSNGHPAGDELLRQVSALLKGTVRDGELVGRYGGEEFLIAFPDTDGATAFQAAERIRKRIAEQAFPFGDRQPLGCLSVSGGIASFPADAGDTASLIQHADEALYQAKHAGRNKVIHYSSPELTEASTEYEEADEPKLDESLDAELALEALEE